MDDIRAHLRNLVGYKDFTQNVIYDHNTRCYYLSVSMHDLDIEYVNSLASSTRDHLIIVRGSNAYIPFIWQNISILLANIVNDASKERYIMLIEKLNNFRFSYLVAILDYITLIVSVSSFQKIVKDVIGSKFTYISAIGSIICNITSKSEIYVNLDLPYAGRIEAIHQVFFTRCPHIGIMFGIRLRETQFEMLSHTQPCKSSDKMFYIYRGKRYYTFKESAIAETLAFSQKTLFVALKIPWSMPPQVQHQLAILEMGSSKTKSKLLIKHIVELCIKMSSSEFQYHTCAAFKHSVLLLERELPPSIIHLTKLELLESIYENVGLFVQNLLNTAVYMDRYQSILENLVYLYYAYDASARYHLNTSNSGNTLYSIISKKAALLKHIEDLRRAYGTINRIEYDTLIYLPLLRNQESFTLNDTAMHITDIYRNPIADIIRDVLTDLADVCKIPLCMDLIKIGLDEIEPPPCESIDIRHVFAVSHDTAVKVVGDDGCCITRLFKHLYKHIGKNLK